MDLTVRLFAGLRDRAGAEHLLLRDLQEPVTIATVKAAAVAACPALGALEGVAGVVGTDYAPDHTVIEAGADVALLPPVSGGAPEGSAVDEALARGVFELWEAPLDLPALEARVRDPRCGAVVSFVGTTRDTHRGKRVLRLEYEAFEAMTGPEMARIFEDVRARCGSVEGGEPRMLCVHRVGTVGVGEPSVAIVVATPHRDDAFSLARGLIDTLKERLPIWKREVLEDGSHWVGERS